MPRKIIIAGNWKMNKTSSEAAALMEGLKTEVAGISSVDIVVCPVFTSLCKVIGLAENTNIKVGAQNVHWEDSGAFTGEIAAPMLKELGVEYAIIGHSERRQYFGETDETVNMRLKSALKTGLKPIVCIGELLEQRENGTTEEVLNKQITVGFKELSKEEMSGVIIAYEPVWAIGTGKTATPEMAQETHLCIRNILTEMFDSEVAEKVRIQYGGSMKPGNAAELLQQPDIDGGLIGGASLKPDAFAAIIKNAN